MKKKFHRNGRRKRLSGVELRRWTIRAMLLFCGAPIVRAAGDAAPGITPAQFFEGGTNAYNNWVEFSAGGLITSGNKAQAEQNEHLRRGAFGGIEDLHYQTTIKTNTTFTVDGHSIFDNKDYNLSFRLKKENLGYFKLSFENFRTWYNNAGGYYPPTHTEYSGGDNALALDRGEVSVEAGLNLKDKPKVVFKYTHTYRDGQKSSTIWGPVHTEDTGATRGLYPDFYNIDETFDTFQLDVTHHIKTTDLGWGLGYETANLKDDRNETFWAGEPVQRRLTDREGTSYGLFNVHAFSETWVKDKLFFSSGFLYSHLDSDFFGSRVYGDEFDSDYMPSTLNNLGYYKLDGGATEQQGVLNLNLMYTPIKDLSIVPSIRMEKDVWDATSSGIGTLGTAEGAFNSQSDRDQIDVTERLDARYKGVTNWVFYGSGEWTEGEGNLKEKGGLAQINGIGVEPVNRQTDDSRLFQKYSVGARWYPLARLNLDASGYYKIHHYDYNSSVDSTPNDSSSLNRYPAYLVMQNLETYDGKISASLRLFQNVSLLSSYEFQYSDIGTKPDPDSGLNDITTSTMTSHIIGQNVSWVPWSRLSLQAGFNYVWSQTETPASDYTRAILNSWNNYWTVNASSSFVVNDRTDLNLGLYYYRANDYQNNAVYGVPFGAGAREYGITAGIVRRISKNMRLTLKYGYSDYHDVAYGGFNDYQAHLISSSLQYRF